MKAKLRQTIAVLDRNTRSLKGVAFLSCFVLLAASAILLVSRVHDSTDTDKTHQSQVTLNPGNFTISDPAKITNSGGVLKLTGPPYATDAPYVTSTNPISYVNLGGFTQTLGGNNAGQVTYRLSPDGTNWYWWNGAGWAVISVSSTIDDANTAAELNDHMDEFASQFGAGNVYIRAFFRSNGSQQVELQNVTVTKFDQAAPVIDNISPTVGGINGGTSVTINGSNFTGGGTSDTITNTWDSPSATIAGAGQYRSMAIVGDYVYLFGGYGGSNNAAIHKAPLSSPTNWSLAGNLPGGANCCSAAAVVGSNLYLYGGYNSSTIYRASMSDPDLGDAGSLVADGAIPSGGDTEGFIVNVIGNYVYLLKGASLYRAPTSAPTTFDPTPYATITGASRYAQSVVIGQRMYVYSGTNIFSANISNLTSWTNHSLPANGTKVLPVSATTGQVVVIGSTIYLYTGSTIMSAPVSDPTTWTTVSGKTIPGGVAYNTPQLAIINSTLYMFSGTVIRSTPITGNDANIYNPSWITNRQTLNPIDVKFGTTSATSVQVNNTGQIVATAPAHAAGNVALTVVGVDGQVSNAATFQYVSPPTVSGVSPNSGSSAGGDTVTITGTNFRAGATVTFGGNAASNVTVVNSTTITATTPSATVASSVDVSVTNTEGQTGTQTNGFTYLDPPPQATSINPVNGPASGGTNFTITGSAFVPPNTTTHSWTNTNKTFSSNLQLASSAVIGSKVYIFGGYTNNKIYSAPTSDPANMTDTGKTMPDNAYGRQVAVIGSKVYIFGGTGSNGKIYSALTSDPTTFTQAGTLPATASSGMYGSQLAVIGSKVYLFGGFSSPDTRRILSANVSDPTTWTDETAANSLKALPGDMGFASLNVINNRVYLFDGSSNNKIYYANTSDPTTWYDSGKVIAGAGSGFGQTAVIGDKIYLFATTGTNTIFSANVSDPLTWSSTGFSLPAGVSFERSQLALVGNNMYLYSGQSTNRIYSAPITRYRPNIYNKPWITNWPTSVLGGDQSEVTFDGLSATNVQFVNSTTITGTTPAHATGSVNVVVKNYDGQSSTLTNGFEYLPPPSVTGIAPASGSTVGGDSVTITGSGFVNGATVKFGNVAATNVVYINSHTITATTPANTSGAKDVIVTNPDGQTGTLEDGYIFMRPPPTISSISPARGKMQGGNEVTITGANFPPVNDVAAVSNGGTPSAFNTYNPAANAFDGNDSTAWVSSANPGSYVQSMFNATYSIGQVKWTKCGSDNAPREAQIQLYQNGQWVTHKQLTDAQTTGAGEGSGIFALSSPEPASGVRMYFNNAGGWMSCSSLEAHVIEPGNGVLFDGVAATGVTYVNSTTIKATVPAHASGKVDVTVTDEFGQSATLSQGYTYLPDAYAFTTSPLNVAATEPGTLTVQARDSNGNPVSSTEDITLQLTTSSGSGFFARDLNEDESTRWSYDSVVLPAGQSSVTFYYKDNLEGTPTVTVKDANNTQVQQQQTIGPRYKLLVTGVSDPVQAGVPSSVTVQAVDYTGQPQTDYTGTIHFTSTDAGASLPPNFTFTPEMLGLHTFVNGVSMGTQGDWCVTATDTISASITGSQCNITVTPPNAGTISKLKIITPQQSFAAGGHSSAITVQTQDVNGLPIPVVGDKTIYVYSTSGTGQFSLDGETGWSGTVPYQITIKSGTTSTNVYYKDNTTGTHTITMRDDAGTGTDFGWTNDSQPIVVGVGAPAQLGVTAGATAAAGEWVPVTVHLQDAVGNDVTSFKNVSVHMASDSGTARFSADPSGSNPATTLDTLIPIGAATATFYVSDTTSGQLILTATDSSPPGNNPYDPGTTNITVGPGEPVAIEFLPVASPVPAGEPQQVAAFLKDIYGNVAVAPSSVSVDFTTSSSYGGFSNSTTGPWNANASVTINPGGSSAALYYRDTKVGTSTISASTSAYGNDTLNLQIIAGEYSGKLGFKSAPSQFTAGVGQTVEVELLDDYNNPTLATTTVHLSVDSSSGTGQFSLDGISWSSTISADVQSGQGSTSVLYRDTKTGSVTIGAQESGKPATRISYTPTIIAAAPSKYIYTSNSQIIGRNAVSQPIAIEIQDQYNNPASAPNGFSANISTTSASGEFSLNGTSGWTSGSLAVPFAAGASSATVRYRDSVNGTYALTTSGNSMTAANQNIRVVEGVPGKIALSSSGSVTAGQSIAVMLKTQTASGIDTPVLADTTFNLSGPGEFSLTASPWNPVSSVTLDEGEGETTLYYRSTEAGINTINADESPSQGWTAGQTDIAVSGADVYRFAFTAKPTSTPVTEASSAFTVSTLDVYGNVTSPSTNTTAYLYTNAGSGSFSTSTTGPWNTSSVTIPAGGNSATFYYRDTTLGTPTITASDKNPLENPDEDILNVVTTLNVIGQQAAKLVFTTAPQSITAGELSSVVTIQLQKSDNTPAIQDGDRTFTFWTGGGGDQLVYLPDANMGSDPITEITIPRGQSSASYYVTGTIAGVKLMDPYTYSFPGVGLMEAKQNITVNAAAPESLVFTTTPQTINANEDSDQIKVELRDVFGNPTVATSSTTINFASSCGSGQFSLAPGSSWSPTTSTVLPAGQSEVYFYYRDSVPATCTMTVSATDLTSGQQNIEVIYSAAVALDFTSGPQTIVAGQTSNNITVSTKDIYGNIATVDTDTTVYFSSTSTTGQFSQNSVVIPAGQSSATVTYRDTKPGTPTLKASDQSGTSDTGLADDTQGITITAGTPTKFAYVPSTFNIVAGQSQQLSIELHNQYDVPIVASGDIPIDLSSTVSDGEFRASNSAGAPVITQATIPANGSSVTVYYRQTTAAAATLTATDPNTGLTTGTAAATVYSDTLKAMHFVTSPQTLEANQPSNAMTVSAVDAFGNTTAFAPTPMTLYLYTSSSTGKFYSDAGLTSQVSSITVNTPNTPVITFYYRDTAVGNGTITVSDRSPLDNPDIGIENATQQVAIVPGVPAKLAITGGSNELERGGADGPNEAVLQNAYGSEVATLTDQPVYLSSSSGTGEFADSATGPWQHTDMVVIPAGQSRAAFYYRDDTTLGVATLTASDVAAPPEMPDAGLGNGTKNITVVSGAFMQLGFTTAPQTITARHPSNIMTVQALNRYGKPTTVTSNTTIYLRSNAATGEFANSASGPWGISNLVMPANGSTVSFYYRDSKDGTPTLRASNSLSTNPAEVIATSQQQTIERQTLSHFLVTNISDPQYQGNPSSVVVAAVDSGNFVIDWYDGTVNFSASDGDAILPSSYTFNPNKDKGIHTFVNGVAFKSAGEKTVTVTDTNGVTGQQTDITVQANPAGAPAKLVFIAPPSPFAVTKNQASEVITLQVQDTANIPTNAGPGGFSVRLTSTAGTGEFATSPSGPWQSAATFTVPQGLNYLNLYYRDSAVGQPQITARDWIAGVDNPAITNATLDVIVNALQISSTQTTSSQNFANAFITNPLLFARNDQGAITGRAAFTAEAREERNNTPRSVNWSLTWKDGLGSIISQQTTDGTPQVTYNPSDVTAQPGDNPFTLDIQATDPSTNEISSATRTVSVSPWQAKITVPVSYTTGMPFTAHVESQENHAFTNAQQGSVEILNSSLQSTGMNIPLASAQSTGTGMYDATLISPGLVAGQTYYALVRLLDVSGNIVAEDISEPFQAQAASEGNTGGGTTTPTNPSGGSGGSGSSSEQPATSDDTNSSGGGPASPSQNQSSHSSNGNDEGDNIWLLSSLGKSLKKFFASPAAPVIVSGSLFGFIAVMAVVLLWQAYKELQQVRLLVAILEREKRTAEDKDNFLQLCAHYLRTPTTIIASSSEILTPKLGEAYAEATQTLGTVVKNLRQKTEQIVTQTTNNQALQSIVSPNIEAERSKLYRQPIFWAPIILSIVLTLIGNWAATAIGDQSIQASVMLQQIAIALIAVILLYSGIRLRAMRRRRKVMLAEALHRRAELDRAKNQFVKSTYDLLAGDVYLLAELQKKLPAEEKFVTMLNDGTKRLEKLMDKFKLLATIDTTQLHAVPFTTTQMVNQTLQELSEDLKAKEITVDRHGSSIAMQQDVALFSRVVSSVLANAIEFNSPGGAVDVHTHQAKDIARVIVKDSGSGFKQDPEELFEAFKRGDDSLDFTHEGIGLDLYLDRLIMRHLGGDITARNLSQGAEVTLHLPTQAI